MEDGILQLTIYDYITDAAKEALREKLREGTGRSGSKGRIRGYFATIKDIEKRADFLKHDYGSEMLTAGIYEFTWQQVATEIESMIKERDY